MKELKLTKPRARYTIIFRPDKDDDWFIYIIHLEKSGKSNKRIIIQKDMDYFLKDYLNNGWSIIENEETIKKPSKKKK